ncbi:response regulator [Lutibacter sp. HS1-25]|uniref:response regulator n=1 Tax=Lutibacter sp. HS1-25 TaxID=2485000 RepID=UPI00101182E1|nr:response regulator [Lutibacter sp. HS1-25]RXP61879.1 response regulator [Lutibacter sp. HS1-25]
MKKKILLIEDDKIVRENTSEILELANYDVKTAENGKKGIELAKAFLPDIIICDILMPILDGYGVLQITSKLPDLEHIPFIFLTAKTHHTDLRKGMELGADDYITKPFEESELLRAIEIRLKRAEVFEQKSANKLTATSPKSIDNLEQFLQKKKAFTYQKGETIYCNGSKSDVLFLVKSGIVKTYKYNELGKEYNTGYYGDKEYFGYVSFLNNTMHFDNAKAISTTRLYKISKEEISEIFNNNHQILLSFIHLLANNLSHSKEQCLLLAYGSVREKTARMLLYLLENYPSKSGYEIFIDRNNLSNSIGVAKETLTRTLNDFKKESFIEITKKGVKILNKEKLLEVK